MHVFVSDLHMTDTDSGTVSDTQLTSFVSRLVHMAEERQTQIKLVFLGDILDLLRSSRWEELWSRHQSAPWSGMGPGFENFAGNYAENCAIAVAEEIRNQYVGFRSSL